MPAEIVDLAHTRTLAVLDELRQDLLRDPEWSEEELGELSRALHLDEFFGEAWLRQLTVAELTALIAAAVLMARARRASRWDRRSLAAERRREIPPCRSSAGRSAE